MSEKSKPLTKGQIKFRVGLCAAGAVVLGQRMWSTPDGTPFRQYWPWVFFGGIAVLVGLFLTLRGGGGGRRRGRKLRDSALVAPMVSGTGSRGTRAREEARRRRNEGMASRWSIFTTASWFAMRRRAKVLRPSFAGRWWIRAVEVAQPLARVGWWTIWSAIEDVTIRVGGPRVGKSGELAGRILDAPGAVIATTTRTDLYDTCAPVLRTDRARSVFNLFGCGVAVLVAEVLYVLDTQLWITVTVSVVAVVPMSILFGPRPREGRPVYVFNPSGLGGLVSTVAFNPLVGCKDPVTANHRAGDLLAGAGSSGGGSDERQHWVEQARRALAMLMHAAALHDRTMGDVLAWAADPTRAEREVLALLAKSTAHSVVEDAKQFFSTNDRTQSSITTTIMPALGWLSDPRAWEVTQPTTDGRRVQLDIGVLLELRGAVFLLGGEEAQSAPLVTALTGYIAREARHLASMSPAGRLDPGLTLVLDEAALVCPVPLDKWTADMGGRNICIHIGVQSFQQLVDRFGKAAAASILTNAGTLMVFGGTRSEDDLRLYSMLAGEREEIQYTHDAWGRVSATTTRVSPTIPVGMVAQLRARQVVLFKRGMFPMIGRVKMAWTRTDVKWAQRAREWSLGVDKVAARARAFGRAMRLLLAEFTAWVRRSVTGTWEQRAERRSRELVEAAQRRGQERDL
jgi:type IV secretion system protein VirD4